MSEKIKEFCRSPNKRLRLIFICGVAGIILILFSEFIPAKSGGADEGAADEELTLDESEVYKENVEKQLADIISQIRGAGKVKVMVTICGTKEYVYAEQSDTNRRTDADGEDVQQKSEIVIADTKNEKQPVVKKITAPQISGAVVVCEGASDAVTKERIMNVIAAALGLPSGRISVEPMK